jgi:hypothetical protein
MANWADGILSPLKAASGLVQEAIEIRDEIKLRDTIIKLSAQIMAAQSGALAAQSDQLSLLDEIRSLKEKVVELEAWNTEKGRYKLTDLGRGLKTYTLKEGMENGEPPHHLCANCYNEGHKSVLQTEIRVPGRSEVLVCHRCGADLYVSGLRYPDNKRRR